MIDPTVSPATNKVIGMIFDDIFPHKVRLNDDADMEEVKEWLHSRMLSAYENGPGVDYTWRAQREIGFRNPKLAMEFKLLFG